MPNNDDLPDQELRDTYRAYVKVIANIVYGYQGSDPEVQEKQVNVEGAVDTLIEIFDNKCDKREIGVRKDERERVRKDFVNKFTNDHDPVEKPRWLRGVAFDMQDLLDQILDFLKLDHAK